MISLTELFTKDRFAEYIGIHLEDVQEGRAVASLTVADHHLNGVGTVQGGVIFTLCDLAFAAAANSTGKVAVALNTTMAFTRPANTGETIRATATVASCGRTTTVVTVSVHNEAGALVGQFQGTAFRKDKDVTLDWKKSSEQS